MNTLRLEPTFGWPMNSASVCGRSEVSRRSSSRRAGGQHPLAHWAELPKPEADQLLGARLAPGLADGSGTAAAAWAWP